MCTERMADELHHCLSQKTATEVVECAPAKINLGLRIVRRRPDGYHDLDTLFVSIPWYDQLTFSPSTSLNMSCDDADLPTDETNLCIQSAIALRDAFGISVDVHIHLKKEIPYGAGLGGGSSDAAATLRGLRTLFSLEISDSDLVRLAATLGSDIPYFLQREPAFGSGRGTELKPWINRPPFPGFISVVVPELHSSTSDAYSRIEPPATPPTTVRTVLEREGRGHLKTDLINDFETVLFPRHPSLKKLKSSMYGLGAHYASMSGSGSAIYGLFDSKDLAEKAASKLEANPRRRWVGRPLW